MTHNSPPASNATQAFPASTLAATLDAIDACIAILSGDDFRYTFVNRAYQAILPGVAMVGMRFRDVFPEAAERGTEEALRDVLKSGGTYRLNRYDAPVPTDPEAVWEGEFVRSAPATGDDRGSIVVLVRNVSTAARVERALAASEDALRKTNEKLRETIDSITDGVLVMDKDWRYTFVSERAAKIIGIAPAGLVGGIVWELFPDAAGTQFYEGYHRAVATGQPVHFEEYYPLPLDKWLECHCYPTAEGLTVYFRDVSDQRRADDALRENAALLRAISNTSDDVIFAKDRQGFMRFANPATLALIGKPLEQVLGKTDTEFLDDPEAARLVMHNDRLVMDAGTPEEFEESVPLPDGQQRIWLSRKIPYLDEGGKVIGLLGISRDITERKRKEHILQEESSRKDEFLAMLAHELRNPLAPIMTGAQLLERFASDEARVKQTSRIIARQASHMVALVDDLLDVSRVTRGLVELKKEHIDINSVIAHAIEQARNAMETRHHDFDAIMAPADTIVLGDRTRLIQAVANILHNAAKYTHAHGRITLAVTVDVARLEIVVRDTGVGIDAALLPRVFDLFTQSERSPDRSQGGLGLGLPLVKSIIAMHGGEVLAESAGVGAGSTFTISLPRARDCSVPAEVAPQPEARPTVPSAGSSILLVDDNEDAGESLAALLRLNGHTVSTATDGYSALAAAQEAAPATFILDIGLPDMDGFELAARIRAQPQFATARLIALTGYGNATDQARGKSAGFDYYLVKPAGIEELSRILVS
jgi:PAS domain S-box-containing protein